MARDAKFSVNALTVKGVEDYEGRSRLLLVDGTNTVTIERKTSLPPKLRKLQAGDVVDVVIQFDEGGG
jgi:hypothetical protein